VPFWLFRPQTKAIALRKTDAAPSVEGISWIEVFFEELQFSPESKRYGAEKKQK
jgi:hypothetical protein